MSNFERVSWHTSNVLAIYICVKAVCHRCMECAGCPYLTRTKRAAPELKVETLLQATAQLESYAQEDACEQGLLQRTQ